MNTNAVVLIAAALTGLAACAPAHAWPGNDCKFKADRLAHASVAGAKSIVIRVGAGDLIIRGRQNGAEVTVHGKACAQTAEQLQNTDVRAALEGDVVVIGSVIPTGAKPAVGNLWGASDPYIDIDIDLPQNIPIRLEDSSGDLAVSDSSGDINLVNSGANVTVEADSSGDLTVDGVAGNFTLGAKGSGDVSVHGVRGKASIPDYKKEN